MIKTEFMELYEKLSKLNESKADTQKLIDFAGETLANKFLALKAKLKAPENDLYYWIKNKTPQELQNKIIEVETTTTKSRQRKQVAQGAELVAENDYWKVYLITTPEAAKIYGKDTRWCISMRDNTMFWEKYKHCDIYVFITKEFYDASGKCSKLALVYDPEDGGFEIFNQRDERLDRVPNCPIIPGVLEDSWLSGAKYYIELDEGLYISTEAPFGDFESELFAEPDA